MLRTKGRAFITPRTRWGRPGSECYRQSRELRVKAAQQLLTRLKADRAGSVRLACRGHRLVRWDPTLCGILRNPVPQRTR